MLSTYSLFRNVSTLSLFSATIIKLYNTYWPLVLVLALIETSHVVAAARHLGLQDSDDTDPTHLNFFRFALRGRQRVLSCANNPDVCLDSEKNPWGGGTCCFQQFCKDTLKDSSHCGACGRVCAYGLVCCDGKCVDIQTDPQHCGSCFEECPGENRCVYAMCGYGG